jgi:membrane protease YdiL (CAAX protease family)
MLGMHRKLNRWSHAMRRRKKPASPDAPRTATPRKGRGSKWLVIAFLILSPLWGLIIWINFFGAMLPHLETTTDTADRMAVSNDFYRLHIAPDTRMFPPAVHGAIDASDGESSESMTPRERRRAYARSMAETLRLPRTTLNRPDDLPSEAQRERFIALYTEHGPDAFYTHESGMARLLLGRQSATSAGRVLMVLAITLAMLIVAAHDLGEVIRPDRGGDWETEWLLALPLRARGIATAEILREGLTNQWMLVLLLPLSCLWFWLLGLRWTALPAGAVTAVSLSMLASAMVTPVRLWLQQHLPTERRANVRAGVQLLAMLLFFGLIVTTYSSVGTSTVVEIVRLCPTWVAYLPWGLPAAAGSGLTSAWVLPAMAAMGVGGTVLGGLVAGRTLSRGLRCPTSPRPAPVKASAPKRRLFGGMVGKEMILLRRDRGYFLQTIVLPLAVTAMQLVINPALARGAGRHIRHSAALAYGVACYAVLFGTTRLLTTEARSLWMLYTFPRRIDSLLRSKAMMLAGIAGMLAAGILAIFVGRAQHTALQLVWMTVLAMLGACIFAMIAAGIGVRAADPFEHNPRRSLSGPTMYTLMLIAGLFVTCFYTASAWTQLVTLTVFTLAAVAIWQNVRHAAACLLDPTQQPPPRLRLSDALLTVFAFFTIQSVLLLIMVALRVDLALAVSVAYSVSAALVAAASLVIFTKRRIPGLAQRLAMVGPGGLGRAVRLGLGLGLLSGAVAIGYLVVLQLFPALRQLQQQAPTLFDAAARDGRQVWIVGLLVVIVAPLVEEYLFRGLLLSGLLRSLRPRWAILASAAIFAVVHPAVSFPPVFLLGLLAAWGVRRTGGLAAGMVAHAMHNGIAFGLFVLFSP